MISQARVLAQNAQVRISRWFGALESTFYKHPHSPHPDIFRVSNDRQHGCTGTSMLITQLTLDAHTISCHLVLTQS